MWGHACHRASHREEYNPKAFKRYAISRKVTFFEPERACSRMD
jgi:hypothetical protein